MSNKLFVGSLSWNTTDDTLRDFFAKVGTVTSAKVITDKYTGKSRGFGFVEMASDEEAKKAVKELENKELDGRTIVVNEARPQAPREDFGGGGRSFNRGSGGGGRDDRRRGGSGGRGGRY